MGNKYYYFAATLPFLNFNEGPPISTEAFLKECERFLSKEDLSDIKRAVTQDIGFVKTRSDVWNEWIEFERFFRNEMVHFRTKDIKKDASDYFRGERYARPDVVNAIVEASKKTNPFEAEKLLDQIRWNFLEDLGCSHHFDVGFLVVYGLKLKILERYQTFSSEEGKDRFNQYQRIKMPQLGT